MKIPLKPHSLDLSQKWPKKIIIHHTEELFLNNAALKFSRNTFQTSLLQKSHYQLTNSYDLPYHFVLDKNQNDYFIIACKPILTLCEFPDIPESNWKDIHVAVIGDHNEDIPENRMYDVLSYRILAPFLRLFNLSMEDVILHRDVSFDDTRTCPGEFFRIEKLRASLRKFYRRRSIARR